MRKRGSVDDRLTASLFAVWLIVAAASVAVGMTGSERIAALCAMAVATLAGLLRSDRRESLAVALASAALTAWVVGGETGELTPLLAAVGVVVTGLLASWPRFPAVYAELASQQGAERQVIPAPACTRLPPGVADEALLDRLAIHEMTRARRYERPLTLLLIGVDGWSALVAERGKRGAFDVLSTLAARARHLLRDVDAIGLHGEGRLAVLLPETPLDGAVVVARRIEQAALGDIGLKTRIGVAVFPEDAGTVEALVREAEAGLELARLEGVSIVERVTLA